MTIYDIAREAGVSIATVSRVMNGGKVGKATRIKVQAVLDSCDYQPSQVAKGLATRQSRCVAVMTMDIRDVHHAAIAYEIERTMATAGYSTILCNLGGTPARAGEYLRTLNAQQIIGVFFVGSIFVTPQCREYIAKYVPNIPILFANAVLPLPNAYGVLSDEEDGTYHAVKRCYRAERSIEGGQFVTTHILQQDPNTDAIVFSEDTTAVGCLHALQVTGKRIPDEVAVIGCNNSVYCTICYPQLTSIDNSLHETGRMAAKQMIRLLNHESDVEKTICLPCRLVLRDTTPPML